MLSLAWLVWVAVVVELCVSMVGWHEHEGAQMCILASLQYLGVQGECTIGFSVVLLAQNRANVRLAGV